MYMKSFVFFKGFCRCQWFFIAVLSKLFWLGNHIKKIMSMHHQYIHICVFLCNLYICTIILANYRHYKMCKKWGIKNNETKMKSAGFFQIYYLIIIQKNPFLPAHLWILCALHWVHTHNFEEHFLINHLPSNNYQL